MSTLCAVHVICGPSGNPLAKMLFADFVCYSPVFLEDIQKQVATFKGNENEHLHTLKRCLCGWTVGRYNVD